MFLLILAFLGLLNLGNYYILFSFVYLNRLTYFTYLFNWQTLLSFLDVLYKIYFTYLLTYLFELADN